METIITIVWLSSYVLFIGGMIQAHLTYKKFLKALADCNSEYVKSLEQENAELKNKINTGV